MPIDTIIIDVRLVPRCRSGRHTPSSNKPPSDRGDGDCHECRGKQRPRRPAAVEPQGDQRAERDHLAVGEVRQPGRAEDQREPDRRDGDDHRQLEAVGEGLRELAPLALGLTQVLAEEERPGRAAVGPDHHTLVRVGLTFWNGDAFGQRLGVEPHVVRSRLLDRDLVVALLVGHCLGDELAVRCLDDDADARDAFADLLAVLEELVLDPTTNYPGRAVILRGS